MLFNLLEKSPTLQTPGSFNGNHFAYRARSMRMVMMPEAKVLRTRWIVDF